MMFVYSVTPILSQNYATIFIYRKNQLKNSGTGYSLLIDKSEITRVLPGSRVEYRLYKNGTIEVLCAEINDSKEKELSYYCRLNFTVEKGKTYYLRGDANNLEQVSERVGKSELEHHENFTGGIILKEDLAGKNYMKNQFDAMEKNLERETAEPTQKSTFEIVILSPKINGQEITTDQNAIKVSGYIKPYIEIMGGEINNQSLIFDENGNFSKMLNLKEGINKVHVSVKDLNGRSQEKSFNIVYQPKELQSKVVAINEGQKEVTYRGSDPFKGTNLSNQAKELKPGKYYALLIGINAYSGFWKPLKNATNDAMSIEKLLTDNYKFEVFKTLYDKQATRDAIIKELEWLVKTVGENDNVLIYYSGHGEFKKELNKGYWVPVDATTASTSNYISNSDIQTFLAGIPSKHTLLVSDACFSGDIFRGSVTSAAFENTDKYYQKTYDLKSRQAISSGGLEPVMDGGKDSHSVFAYYLIQALTTNTSKYFDASQLFSKIKIPVGNNSEQSPDFNPIKNTGDEGGNFIFIRK
ncbi:caspase family protein [Aurantibacillus circumpalustris]|uniref:caspase family protein n=1 Tax=Aurantibacillus circumpalustris TaxID=3036359 RepID=UPI00295A84AF|nr:caspase family protein [Aurantibacillus circumpalustris]